MFAQPRDTKPDLDRLAREIRSRRERIGEVLRLDLGEVTDEAPASGRLQRVFASFQGDFGPEDAVA